MNIDTQLKKIREKTGFTQVVVAEKAKITERSYQRYEAGERIPNVRTAQLIAQALNAKVEEIFHLQRQSDGNPTETTQH